MATVRPLQDPIALFQKLLAEAEQLPREQVPEPTALALATANQEGQPSVRMVLLKNVDERGFVFFTNLESRKSRDLSFNRRAAMCFHWAPLERQVRVEGVIAPVSVEEADEYFASRARMSQLGAWASRQSRTMEAPGDLDERVAEYEAKFEGQKVPPRSLVMGSPGKVKRLLTQAEIADIQRYADVYVGYRLDYMSGS